MPVRGNISGNGGSLIGVNVSGLQQQFSLSWVLRRHQFFDLTRKAPAQTVFHHFQIVV